MIRNGLYQNSFYKRNTSVEILQYQSDRYVYITIKFDLSHQSYYEIFEYWIVLRSDDKY